MIRLVSMFIDNIFLILIIVIIVLIDVICNVINIFKGV